MNAERDAGRFTALLETVGEIYDVTVSPARSTLYFGSLREFEYEIVELAVSKYLESEASKFGFPKPAHLREIIEGSQSDQESHAWLSVNDAIRKIGIYQSLIVADVNVSDAIVRVFGSWAGCCEQARDANAFSWENRRRDFVSAFRIARKIQRRNRAPVLLGGLCEIQNRARGRFPGAQPYGAILLDGTVETRYLEINPRTGLPAARLSDVLQLPEPMHPARMIEEPETGELVGADAIISLEDAFRRLLESRSFPTIRRGGAISPTREITQDERDEDARREKIKRQVRAENNPTQKSTGDVRARETAAARNADHDADHGGGSARTETGIHVRGKHRAKVGGGSRVAGVENSVRARGGRVRESDHGGAGQLHNRPDTLRKRKKNVR